MNKNKKYRLIKDFPNRNIGDIIYWDDNPIGRWFWEKGGAIPTELTMTLEGLPNISEWFEEVEELCVPVATKIKYKHLSDTVFTIINIDKNDVTIETSYNDGKISIKELNRLFKEGLVTEYKEDVVYCTTEDGVKIKNPIGVVYWVNENFKIYTKKASNCKSNVKYYSTRKAAENFIKCNKPVLSYKEVLELYDENWIRPDRGKFKSQLTKLVKSKL
jgi:hypothetical protein